MGKHSAKKKRGWSQYQQENERTLAALQVRASTLCSDLGHMLGVWGPAKKKHGFHSMKCLCLNCGEQVVIIPRHYFDVKHPQVPALKGDILFQCCTINPVVT